MLPHPAAIPAEPVGLPEFLVRFQQVPVFRRPDRRSYWVPIHIHTLHSTSYIFSHIILSTQGNHRIYYITLHSVILQKKRDGAIPFSVSNCSLLYKTRNKLKQCNTLTDLNDHKDQTEQSHDESGDRQSLTGFMILLAGNDTCDPECHRKQ